MATVTITITDDTDDDTLHVETEFNPPMSARDVESDQVPPAQIAALRALIALDNEFETTERKFVKKSETKTNDPRNDPEHWSGALPIDTPSIPRK